MGLCLSSHMMLPIVMIRCTQMRDPFWHNTIATMLQSRMKIHNPPSFHESITCSFKKENENVQKKHCIYSIFPCLRSAAVPIPWKLLGYTLLHPDPGANWCCTLGGSCKVCKYEQHQKTRLRWKAQMWWKELELLRVKQNFWPILFFPSISGEISFSAFLLAPLYRVATLVKTFQAKDTIEDIWTTEVLPDLSEQSCLLLCTKIQDKQ